MNEPYDKKLEEAFIEELNGYGLYWTSDITEENVRSDKDFVYLEIRDEELEFTEFVELGVYMEADPIEEWNSETYRLRVDKDRFTDLVLSEQFSGRAPRT